MESADITPIRTTTSSAPSSAKTSEGSPAETVAIAPEPDPPTSVKEVLGYVSVDGEPSAKEGGGNSTQWVFSLTLWSDAVCVHLQDYRSGKVLPLRELNVSLTPCNAAYWEAKPFVELGDDGSIVVRRSGNVGGAEMLVAVHALAPNEIRVAKAKR